ncbi:MAG TPA: hypothetical protein VK525_23260 [Candidatus Saccharimonadales bacterium]|nr:hypothetical protein [Candidatus Saccharimonadales bacterium]
MAHQTTPDGTGLAAGARPARSWKLGFRIFRWSTYAVALATLLLIFHKAAPPAVQTSAQATARVEEKLAEVDHELNSGEPATLRMDETELNSYLVSHLELEENPASVPPASTPPSSDSGKTAVPAPTAEETRQMRSNVRDVKVQLVADRLRAYVVFRVYGRDLSLQLEGHLGARNGFINFDPTSAQLGAFPIPQSSIRNAFGRMLASAENREKLRLPDNIADLHIENGELVATYK